jgi:hypothetical protein
MTSSSVIMVVGIPSFSPPQLWGLAKPEMPTIPMPDVFGNPLAYTYTGNAFVSPSLGAKSILPVDLTDPDTIVIQAPPKIEYFNTPQGMEYVPIPPNTADTPPGVEGMLDFMGFTKQDTQPTFPNVSQGVAIPAPTQPQFSPPINRL